MQEVPEKKLGRGLSALLGESKLKQSEANDRSHGFVKMVELTKITAGIYQPRKYFSQDELQDLADSIKINGVLQPIILRTSGDEGDYEIIAGERRFRAAKIAGLREIPAVIKKINNHEALELALIENVQREDLSLLEEAEGYQRLVDEFSYSYDQIAQKIGKSRSHVNNILRLRNLPKEVQEMLSQKKISMGHARALINSKNPRELAKKIITDSLNVRDVEGLVREEKIETINKNTPLFVRTESQIRFVNSDQIALLENELTGIVGSEVKIAYNAFRQSGKIQIKFSEIAQIQDLIARLKLD
ncbi:MAG: ParB/RepB/Spo0J family partition protein [Proteobacteria bacterium]|nr:ParB/RepB/Spo0J family partition protein [Pseudomonadota bacterium]